MLLVNPTSSAPRFPLKRAHFGAGQLDLKDTRWKKVKLHESNKKTPAIKQAVYKERSPSTLHPFKVPLMLIILYFIFLNSSSFLFVFTPYFSFLKRPSSEHQYLCFLSVHPLYWLPDYRQNRWLVMPLIKKRSTQWSGWIQKSGPRLL